MKLLIPFCGVPSIYFPVGKIGKGGTCEFATDKCLKMCAAFRNATDENKIGYEPKLRTFELITKERLFLVCDKILQELHQMDSKILYWFASGDCMMRHSEKIAKIMKHLSEEGIVQCGFTKNKTLWRRTHQIKNVRVALTLDKFEQDSDFAKTYIKDTGLIAVPNYEKGCVNLFWCEERWMGAGACGYSDYEFEGITYEADCQKCYETKRGCFIRFEERG